MTVHNLLRSLFLLLGATLLAVVEIEAEGKYGWGEKFATWYRTRGRLAKLYMRLTNKPMTGYHLALQALVYWIFLWPMVQLNQLSWSGLWLALAQCSAWVMIWDFIWFILNPAYGWSNFRRDRVWWFSHEPWIGNRFPLGYLVLASLSLGFGALAGHLADQAVQLAVYALGALMLATLGRAVFVRYQARMHTRDDRAEAGIFHATAGGRNYPYGRR